MVVVVVGGGGVAVVVGVVLPSSAQLNPTSTQLVWLS